MADLAVREHLLLDSSQDAEFSIQVLPYDSILTVLKSLCSTLSSHEKVWLTDKASYALIHAVPKVCVLWQGSQLFRAPSCLCAFSLGKDTGLVRSWKMALKAKPSSQWVSLSL